MPWKLYRFKYEDYPEYSARITGHYAADLLLIEEEGELDEEAVRLIKDSLGVPEDARKFEITPRDVVKLPLEELPDNDRKTLLDAAGKLNAEGKLHLEYLYRPEI
ncbi:hypothetical protein [Thermococcus sp.]|uniref:hypothetical protein n=1 Tax=Thermococcus sp. TaxID=35749 RepID=UPI0025F1339D|nr:hypothetical protein [Thermococcus sp.]